ncbi:MAG: N-formylglutamate amidohydrolase [Proteobacteria bacterium]|nr:N-formylglutamate amidohydrolase [Pseudomonadota bacterium]
MTRRRATAPALLVTAEHGGNRVPAAYRALFASHADVLATHRGYDPGALTVARALAARLGAPLVSSTTTRLLVDLNRSLGHRRLHSEFTRSLPRDERQRIVERHWRPYRDEVERHVVRLIDEGRRVVHVSSHSFTPVLDGKVRNADIGLLYDPGRAAERSLAARWRAALVALQPGLRVRMNYPYTGRADGLARDLRRRFPASRYAGIELEVNQRYVLAGGRDWTMLRRVLLESIVLALG